MMNDVEHIRRFLLENNSDFEIIYQDKPIYSADDAASYYDVDKLAPVLILQADNKLICLIRSVKSGKIDFAKIKKLLNCKNVEMAKPDSIKHQIGFQVGAIPLIGLTLPTIFDNQLLEYDYIYGGIGDMYCTLKITPSEVKRLNNIIATIN